VENKFIKTQSTLLSLIPFLLIIGPFLADLIFTLISLSVSIYIFKKKKFEYFINKFFIFFLFFYIYLLLNSFFINFNLDSVKISFFYFRFGLFVICFWFLLNQDRKLLKKIFFVLLICFSLLIIDGYIQFYFEKNLFGFSIHESKRVSSFFNDELILGSFLSRLFPIFFGLAILIFNKNKKYLFLISIIFILTEVLIFLSGERSALFYMNFSAVYIIILIKKFKVLRLVTLILSLILIIVLSQTYPKYKERIVDQTISQMGITSKSIENKSIENKISEKFVFSKQHTHHYISAIKMFEINPIFGVGVKNFRNLCSKDQYMISELSCSTHPHNTYIQLLAETGIIGFLIILLCFIYFSFVSIKYLFSKNFREDNLFDFQVCITSAIMISLWPLVPTGNFFNNWLNIIYFYPLGIYLWSNQILKKNKNISI